MQFVVGKSSGLSVLYACVRPKMRHLTPDLLTQVFLFPPQISLPHSPCPTLPVPLSLPHALSPSPRTKFPPPCYTFKLQFASLANCPIE